MIGCPSAEMCTTTVAVLQAAIADGKRGGAFRELDYCPDTTPFANRDCRNVVDAPDPG